MVVVVISLCWFVPISCQLSEQLSPQCKELYCVTEVKMWEPFCDNSFIDAPTTLCQNSEGANQFKKVGDSCSTGDSSGTI